MLFKFATLIHVPSKYACVCIGAQVVSTSVGQLDNRVGTNMLAVRQADIYTRIHLPLFVYCPSGTIKHDAEIYLQCSAWVRECIEEWAVEMEQLTVGGKWEGRWPDKVRRETRREKD